MGWLNLLCPPHQMTPQLLLLTKEHVILADPKATQPKVVISLSDIRATSVTRFSDGLLVLHLKEVPGAAGCSVLPAQHTGNMGASPPPTPQTGVVG